MPIIYRYSGLIIEWRTRDHPPPHVHARYGDFEVMIEVKSGKVTGRMPPKQLKSACQWVEENRQDILLQWDQHHGQR
ncbi:DUF4160 domain-containing protein [Parasalinivibrio latis]|uniref:DUF4160 domain-containing protein n=1 Tax=Parasalinivibrio latis TaxID=2952610 RepID=UPI003DA37241